MLTKIISGGQTGADRAGLIVAKKVGLQTGGTMPKGFKAHDGNHPEFADLYGVKEDPSPTYPPRTFKNAYEGDGTVRFAVDFTTSGEKLTLTAVERAKKPHFDVHVLGNTQPSDLVDWIIENKIRVLNVAGNSEKTAPGIGEFVQMFLLETIEQLHGRAETSQDSKPEVQDEE